MGQVKGRGYVPQEIEPKWQQRWQEAGVMHASDSSPKPKYYNLVMFPYPSGELHMGHMKNYTIGDLYARFMRMRGFEVLMGIFESARLRRKLTLPIEQERYPLALMIDAGDL